jgi:hypothetical protein
MTSADVIRTLEFMRDKVGPILDSSKSHVFASKIANLKSSRSNPWGYEFGFDESILFLDTKDKNGRLVKPEIMCNLRWNDSNEPPTHQEITVRIWSSDDAWCFLPTENEQVGLQIIDGTRGRVITRFHFDLANIDQPGPKYHLQYGGNARDDEFCWIPKDIDLPRIVHQPMDLILTTQLIVANYYPNEYAKIFNDPSGLFAVRSIEQNMLLPYYQQCCEQIENKKLLLGHLWNEDL